MHDDHLTANRANWDDRTRVHLASRFYDVEGWLAGNRGPRSWEVAALGDVRGLRLVHLQCHFGLDTLTWARAGADVTGLDFSSAAIEAARDIAARAGLTERSRFVRADVLAAAEALAGETFDVVYVSLGALCWLPVVDRWAEQVATLTAPGGRFYIHDVHPLVWAMDDDSTDLRHTYFEETEPFADDSDITYADGPERLVNTRTYEWNHGLGEIVSGIIRHGLTLDWLAEHDWTVWRRFPFLVETDDRRWVLPAGHSRFPLTFSLLATRPPS